MSAFSINEKLHVGEKLLKELVKAECYVFIKEDNG